MKGGVYQPAGRKYWRVWIPWKGKKLYFNKYLDGSPLYHEGQARRLLERIRGEIDAKRFDPANWGKDITVRIEEAWRVYQDQATCGLVRLNDRQRIYDQYILPYFDGWSLTDIEENHIKDWLSKLPKELQPSTLNVILATLKAFFKSHQVTRRKAFLYPTVKIPHKEKRWLTKEEQDRVLKEVPPRHQGVIRFLCLYGCRVSEACNLKRSDVDWTKMEITLRDRKNGIDNTLPIVEEIEEWLRGGGTVRGESLSHDACSLRKFCPPLNLIYVFSTALGRPYSRRVVGNIWTAAVKKAGLTPIALKNGTRHSLANQLAHRGEGSWVIARVLGNTEKVVEKNYKGSASIRQVADILSHKTVTKGRT